MNTGFVALVLQRGSAIICKDIVSKRISRRASLTFARKIGELLIDTLSNNWTCPGHCEEQQERCLEGREYQKHQNPKSCQWPVQHAQILVGKHRYQLLHK